MTYLITSDQSPPSGQALTDEALARQAQSDPQVFAALYRRHLSKIYRYHLARVGDQQDAQDLTAQTFLAAFEQITRFQARSSFTSWIFGIASHKAADHFRQRRNHLPLESVAEVPDPDPLPEEAALDSIQLEQVAGGLSRINPERAEAVALRIAGGLSPAEVGQVMGKSEAAAKMLVHRGIQALKNKLLSQEVTQ